MLSTPTAKPTALNNELDTQQMTDSHESLSSDPDIMNDPAYDTSRSAKEKGLDEADTCRICRGEGSKEEPLFYPCKCSGSIKFVHQGCLMEWLSHSQKKYCELCKTHFRFTKLYHPKMPRTVPLQVFLRQVVLNLLNNLITWARWHLVILVWLGWVPWCMRTVWRGLFWVGDGGWIDWHELQRQHLLALQREVNHNADQAANSTNAAWDILTTAGNTTIIGKFFVGLSFIRLPVTQIFNFSTTEPSLLKGARSTLRHLPWFNKSESLPELIPPEIPTPTQLGIRAPSLLSEFQILKNATRWPVINSILIDILEGQIITISICVAFILVFLIREWVVQQAPGINMGAGLDAAPPVEVPLQPREPVPALQQLARQHAQQHLPQARDTNQQQEAEPGTEDERQNDQSGEATAGSPAPSATFHTGQNPSPLHHDIDNEQIHQHFPKDSTLETVEAYLEWSQAEHARNGDDNWPGIDIFMEIWRRANGSPSRVLEIIEEEDEKERLGWIVKAMEKLISQDQVSGQPESSKTLESIPALSSGERAETASNDSSQESWQAVDAPAGKLNDVSPTVTDQEIPFAAVTQTRHDSEDPRALLRMINHDEDGSTGTPEIDGWADVAGSSSTPAHDATDPTTASDVPDDEGTSDLSIPLAESYVFQSDPRSSSVSSQMHDGQDQGQGNVQLGQGAEQLLNHDTSDVNQTALSSATLASATSIQESVMEWLWGSIPPLPAERPIGPRDAIAANAEEGQDDAHVVGNPADEAPFVPIENGQPVVHHGDPGGAEAPAAPNPEVMRAAAEAGINLNDADPAIDDGEDLEGIMELIGVQGPIIGLVQNGVFSAVLISITVFLGVWIPYILGKVVLVVAANPLTLLIKLPLRWLSSFADLAIDGSIFFTACLFYWVDRFSHIVLLPIGWIFPFLRDSLNSKLVQATALSYSRSSMDRLGKMFMSTGDSFWDSDIPVFSIIARESLQNLERRVVQFCVNSMEVTLDTFRAIGAEDFRLWSSVSSSIIPLGLSIKDQCISIPGSIGYWIIGMQDMFKIMNPLALTLSIPKRAAPLDFSLADWSTKDRVLAVCIGYSAVCVAGFLYLKLHRLFEEGGPEQRPGTLTAILFQAGGVMKVILIISIEMIVFPLYCGLLLDVALLPLFEKASLVSRMEFTLGSPATSLFVHWFVGTCYMFHFALFVSMCRKIMRTGVLYFIRDPDDPTFHPVRDVLERNVATQLRKIAFSAMVYGALVMICLGGVIWGLAYSVKGVFPIHWSSNEPVLEFPVDLLVYNFLMPVAIKFFRPSAGLNVMYEWWFKKCARFLRLSEFLFGQQRDDEEGHRALRTWIPAWISNRLGLIRVDGQPQTEEENNGETGLISDGCYVRAPASDQVRIPKGAHTFVEVDQNNNRIDGFPDSNNGLHGRTNQGFKKLYIPPLFRARICVFILLIWLFAASTGVSMTILPLLWGRYLFSQLAPFHLRMNDIYAFAIGIYSLASPIYAFIKYRRQLGSVVTLCRSWVSDSMPRKFARLVLQSLRLFYVYTAVTIVLPSLLALIMELYILIPLHTYASTLAASSPSSSLSAFSLSNATATSSAIIALPTSTRNYPTNVPAPHTIHFIQDWTLGVLYVKSLIRMILWYDQTRPANALRAIVARARGRGWLDPDVRLATRAFILPVTIVCVALVAVPLGLGWSMNKILAWSIPSSINKGSPNADIIGVTAAAAKLVPSSWWTGDAVFRACVYRYSYPACAAIGLAVLGAKKLEKGVGIWRDRVRDEVYLIGERLHNFGEGKEKDKEKVVTNGSGSGIAGERAGEGIVH
ncbi:hypothetical protein MMC25_006498 [Agyrium rufum]|nr:hypothetical protein [Agyrium rufum]